MSPVELSWTAKKEEVTTFPKQHPQFVNILIYVNIQRFLFTVVHVILLTSIPVYNVPVVKKDVPVVKISQQ